MKGVIFILLLAVLAISAGGIYAQDNVGVFPTTPYDRFIIYQNLALFWIAIIGLIIIIKLKLKEIERIQKLGINREEKDIPFLD